MDGFRNASQSDWMERKRKRPRESDERDAIYDEQFFTTGQQNGSSGGYMAINTMPTALGETVMESERLQHVSGHANPITTANEDINAAPVTGTASAWRNALGQFNNTSSTSLQVPVHGVSSSSAFMPPSLAQSSASGGGRPAQRPVDPTNARIAALKQMGLNDLQIVQVLTAESSASRHAQASGGGVGNIASTSNGPVSSPATRAPQSAPNTQTPQTSGSPANGPIMHAMSNAANSAGANSNEAKPLAVQVPPQTAAERNGLRFSSLEMAIEWNDKWRRDLLLPGLRRTDDVDQVEANKEEWVRKVRDAIEHEEYLKAGDTWPVSSHSTAAEEMDEEAQAEWARWQSQYVDVTDVITSLPGSREETDLRAWSIVVETIKIHRKGYQVTDQTKNRSSTCSERLNLAITALKQYAIVRSKILDNDRIQDFCTRPVDYAATTLKHLRNNYSRAGGKNKRATKAGMGRSAISKNGDGAVVRRMLPKEYLAQWKKEIQKEETPGVGGDEEGDKDAAAPTMPGTESSGGPRTEEMAAEVQANPVEVMPNVYSNEDQTAPNGDMRAANSGMTIDRPQHGRLLPPMGENSQQHNDTMYHRAQIPYDPSGMLQQPGNYPPSVGTSANYNYNLYHHSSSSSHPESSTTLPAAVLPSIYQPGGYATYVPSSPPTHGFGPAPAQPDGQVYFPPSNSLPQMMQQAQPGTHDDLGHAGWQ